ncbi:unnamed protein product [Prunus armeniaca]
MENIRAGLRGEVIGQAVDNDDDDDEDECDDDMGPEERRNFKQSLRASKQSAWEREHLHKLANRAQVSRTSGGAQMRRGASVRELQPTPPMAPSLYKSSKAHQKSVWSYFARGNVKEGMGRLISKFFIYDNVPVEKESSHHFKNMVLGCQQASVGVQPPTSYETRCWRRWYLIRAVHKVYSKLNPASPAVGQFGNELTWFKDARRTFGEPTSVAARTKMSPTEWWIMYGTDVPTVRKLEKLVYCYYNMKLQIRDKEAERDHVNRGDPLDVFDIAAEDDDTEERVLEEEVGSSNIDSLEELLRPRPRNRGIPPPSIPTQPQDPADTNDSSSTRSGDSPTTGGGNDEGYSGAGSSGGYGNYVGLPPGFMSPFTGEANFTHATQDEDHGSRRGGPGIGAIGKDYARREIGKAIFSSQEDNSLSITSDCVGVGSSNYDYTHNQPFPYPSYPIPFGKESSSSWKESETQSSNDFAHGQCQPISDPYG